MHAYDEGTKKMIDLTKPIKRIIRRIKALRRLLMIDHDYCSPMPRNYLKGYRRLADDKAHIQRNYDPTKTNCWTCRHSVGYVSWHCDRKSCNYEPCFTKSQLTRSQADSDRWLSLPSR